MNQGLVNITQKTASIFQFLQQKSVYTIVVQVTLFTAILVAIYTTLSLVQKFILLIKNGIILQKVPSPPISDIFLGHLWPLIFTPQKSAYEITREYASKYRPFCYIRLGVDRFVVTADKEAIRRIFVTKSNLYGKDLNFSYGPLLDILGTGLLTSNGPLWRKQRTLLGPTFRIEILKIIVQVTEKAVSRLCQKLERIRDKKVVVDMEHEFRLLTLQVIAEAVLSLPPEESDKVFPRLYLPCMEEANMRVLHWWRSYIPSQSWFAYRRNIRALNLYILNLLDQRYEEVQQGKKRDDVLYTIFQQMRESGEDMTKQKLEQLCFEIKTILLAGHETSAAMLSIALLETILNKDVLQKVKDEYNTLNPTSAPLTQKIVEQQIYTLAVLKESLRLHSPVPCVTRQLNQDDNMLGYQMPKGTNFLLHTQLVQDMYFKDSGKFDPERFLPGGEYDQVSPTDRPYVYLPFIVGPRNCVGQFMALYEGRVVLSKLLNSFDFEPISKTCEREWIKFPICLKGGCPCYVH